MAGDNQQPNHEQSAAGATCETCRHWRPGKPKEVPTVRNGIVEGLTVAAVGECRRGPPGRDYTWPKTYAADACGEWEGKETKKEKSKRKKDEKEGD